MPIQMESAVCDTNRKKGTAFSIRRWLKTQVQKLYVRSKDTETPAGHAGNQTVFFSWRVRTESSFRMACLECDCLADNSAIWKGPFIKSVFQKQSNGTRVAFSFQESGLCKHGLKSVHQFPSFWAHISPSKSPLFGKEWIKRGFFATLGGAP